MRKTFLVVAATAIGAIAIVAYAKPPVLTDQTQYAALQTQVTNHQAQIATLQTQVTALQTQLSTANITTINTTLAYICTNFISVQTAVVTPNPCNP